MEPERAVPQRSFRSTNVGFWVPGLICRRVSSERPSDPRKPRFKPRFKPPRHVETTGRPVRPGGRALGRRAAHRLCHLGLPRHPQSRGFLSELVSGCGCFVGDPPPGFSLGVPVNTTKKGYKNPNKRRTHMESYGLSIPFGFP